MKLLASLLLPLFCSNINAALDPGGVAFDFLDFDPSPDIVEPAENLVRNGSFEDAGTNPMESGNKNSFWRGTAGVHVPASRMTDELREFRGIMKARSTREAVEDNPASGRWCARVETPESLKELIDPFPQVSNKIITEVYPATEEVPRRHKLSFKARGTSGRKITLFAFDNTPVEGKDTNELIRRQHFGLSSEWRTFEDHVIVPPGCAKVSLHFSLYGCGTMYLDDVSLHPVDDPAPVDVRLVPFAFMDNLYCIGEGMAGQLAFGFDSTGDSYIGQDLRFELELPKGFRLLESCLTFPLIETRGDTYVFSLRKVITDSHLFKKYYAGRAPSFIIESDREASDKLYEARYSLSGEGWTTPVHSFHLQVVPAATGARPRRFLSGARLTGEFNLEGAGLDAAEALYRSTGFNAIQAGEHFGTRMADLFRMGSFYWFANSYRLGRPPHPPEAQFRDMDGNQFARSTCPVEIYKEGDFFRGSIIPMLEEAIVEKNLFDFLWSNWEPGGHNSKGCFCDRCLEEFARYSAGKAPEEDIRASWPKDTLRKHFDLWVSFRSWQHGRLVATIERHVRKIGEAAGKTSRFMPGISIHYANGISNYKRHSAQFSLDDYMRDLEWLDPWGPYISTYVDQYYEYLPARHLPTYAIAEQTRRYISSVAPKLKLMAYPHGVQGALRVTEPEAIPFEMQCFMLQKWEGATIYFFPRGYDYRYWAALARGNTQIALAEDFVFDGSECTERVGISPETGVPEIYHARSWSEDGSDALIPGLADYGMIQHKAFELGDRMLVAVGNFWQKGEHFFRMRVAGLKGRYNVSTPGANFGHFTSEELADGILLQVGALRWRYVIIAPDTAAGESSVTSQAEMRRLMEARLPSIRQALEWESEQYAGRLALEGDDGAEKQLAKMGPVTNAGVAATIDGATVHVRTDHYSLIVQPDNGGRISQWIIGGETLVGPELGFATPGFMHPAKPGFLDSVRMSADGLRAVDGGLRLELSHLITKKDNMELEGIEVRTHLTFRPKGIKVATKLHNTSDDTARELSFRYHNMPEFTEARFSDGQVFRRNYTVELYRRGEMIPGLETNRRVLETKSTELLITPRNGDSRLKFAFPDSLRYLMFWDAARQPTSTLEPIFDPVAVNPSGTMEFWMDIEIVE